MTTNNIISEHLKVLVFRSNIDTPKKAALVRSKLLRLNRVYGVDIDLEDSENVLRIECDPVVEIQDIEAEIFHLGFDCEQLPT